jgi:hypothetical protein
LVITMTSAALATDDVGIELLDASGARLTWPAAAPVESIYIQRRLVGGPVPAADVPETAGENHTFAGHRADRQTTEDGWAMLAILPPGMTQFESVGMRAGRQYEHRLRIGTGEWKVFPTVAMPAHRAKLRGRLLIGPDEQFKRNNGAHLVRRRDGSLLMIYARWPTASDHARGTVIGVIESDDGGKTWTEPRTLFAEKGFDLYNVSLLRLADGRIGLSYTKRRSGEAFKQWGEKVYRYSADDGASWSDEVTITEGKKRWYQTSRAGVLRQLRSGRLLQPVTIIVHRGGEHRAPNNPPMWASVFYSDDNGRTWRPASPLPMRGWNGNMLHESSLVEWAPDQLLMLSRTPTGWLWANRSSDGGKTWSDAKRTNIPSPEAPPQLIDVPDSNAILLFWNPYVGVGKRLGPRPILASTVSRDGGKTWTNYREIEHADVAHPWATSAGYCYLSGCWVADTLHVVYSDMRGSDAEHISTRYLVVDRDRLIHTDAELGERPQARKPAR